MKLFSFGFHTSPYKLKFENEPDYIKYQHCFSTLDMIASLGNMHICVLDFYKHEYSYMSNNHIFNCGYSEEENDAYKQSFADKIVFDDDREEQLSMKDAALLFMAEFPEEQLKKTSIYSSHRLKHKNGTVMLVSNKFRPILFDDEGNIWMVMCITTLANRNHKIETRIETEVDGEEKEYIYNEKKKVFTKSTSKKLSQKEQEILILCAQGFTSKEIAEKKYISLSTVKFHKQNILSKFHLNNMSEAILYAYAQNLFGKANEYLG